jgi:hypothetical protein
MTKEEFLAKTKEISSNLNDQAKVNSLLTGLYEEYEKTFDSNTQLTSVNETLTTKNQELKEFNMDLFMKLGKQEKDQNNQENNNSFKMDEGEEDKEKPKLKYEDLFNEKGELK